MNAPKIISEIENKKSTSSNKSWCVYILECQDGSFYTGITNDLEKRMNTHKSGKGSKYVKIKGFKRVLHTIKAIDKVKKS